MLEQTSLSLLHKLKKEDKWINERVINNSTTLPISVSSFSKFTKNQQNTKNGFSLVDASSLVDSSSLVDAFSLMDASLFIFIEMYSFKGTKSQSEISGRLMTSTYKPNYRAKFSFDQSNLPVYLKNSSDYPNKSAIKVFFEKKKKPTICNEKKDSVTS
ncbi:hypothetical protein C2G38_1303204 [Gigaspora rosea]|uniref:Uncharacterized protein n=1 Tax=Gigaspora rosea TaxID=44941 RepID=A0A397V8Y4_9GLOM|nr:hypothetical protein C2G38_1303204 [Gigaspora rosea]